MEFSELLKMNLDGTLSWSNVLWVILATLILGALSAVTYIITHKNEGYSKSIVTTLFALPIVIAVIILIIDTLWLDSSSIWSNATRAISIAGVFAIVRFRSVPSKASDMLYYFISLAVGFACGMGFIGLSFLSTIIIVALLLSLHFLRVGETKNDLMLLKIVLPENLNYNYLFDDIFLKYTTYHKLQNVKTSEFGSVFTLSYIIRMKKDASSKDFIDEIRIRNGNLNIVLGQYVVQD